MSDVCTVHECSTCQMDPLAGEDRAAWLARVRGIWMRQVGMFGLTPEVACLTTEWQPTRAVADQIGKRRDTVTHNLVAARRRGAPIESRRHFGWRLRAEAS